MMSVPLFHVKTFQKRIYFMINSWIVLIPPVLVLVLAFSTHKVRMSLLLGILSAALILHKGAVRESLCTVVSRMWNTVDLGTFRSLDTFFGGWRLLILLFLFGIGILIALIGHSGGAHAYGELVKKRLKSKRATEFASLLLSPFFFIDDYFGCFTVGSVMRPLTDKYKIARAKLAFLVDSFAAPICLIVPVSSWVAVTVMQMKEAGISVDDNGSTIVAADPFYLYLTLIPFAFYSIIMICSALFIVWKRISFGLMKDHEDCAQIKGDLFCGKKPFNNNIGEVHLSNVGKESVWDFVFPIFLLITSVFGALLFFGDTWIFGGTQTIAHAMRNAEIAPALFAGMFLTLSATIILLFARGRITLKMVPQVLRDGFDLMFSVVIMLILAWTFSSLLKNDLQTGHYVANTFIKRVPLAFLPLLFLVVSSFVSAAMASAWGTLTVMIPIVVPMVVSLCGKSGLVTIGDIPILVPAIAAVLAGAVAGNHLSPISDTTIMSAASSGCYHIDHVKTQLWYAIPTVISTGVSFLIAGFLSGVVSFGINAAISLGVGLGLNIAIISIFHQIWKTKKPICS
jgi:tetracycline resistance efflux pump